MKKTQIIACLLALLFTTSMNNTNSNSKGLKAYDNLYELGSTQTPKRANEETVEAQNLVSDVKVQVTTLEENQTRDMRFVAAIDSLNYDEVGFEITLIKSETESKTITQKVEVAYTGIEIGGVVSKTSTFFGSTYNYMIAFELTDIPAASYGYQYSAVAYVKNDDVTTKSETTKDVVVSNIAFDDMVNNAITNSRSYSITKVAGYNDTWISFGWDGQTSFTAADVDLTKDVYIRLTLDDGTTLYYDKGNSSAYQDGTYGFNCEFKDLKTSELSFKKVEFVINNNGELNYFAVEFNQLPTLSNVLLDENYVLTFDTIENVSSYSVRIYNDTYSGSETVITSGSTLNTAGLEVGTYNVDITAVGNFGYTNSVTTLVNAITIENVEEIVNGTDYFDFEFVHSGNAWEGVINFTALSSEYAVTGTHQVSNFELYAGEEKVSNAAINDYNGAPGSYDYTKDDGTHSFSFTTNEWYKTNTTYTVKFLLTTDNNKTFSIEFSYIVGEVAEGEFEIDINSYSKNHFVLLLNNTYNSLNSEDYEENVWTLITNLYNEQLAVISAENTTNEEADAAVKAFNTGISNYIEQKLTFHTAGASTGNASLAIDKDSSTRWESDHTNDGQYIIVHLDQIYSLSRLNISWEAANAESYNILVSTDEGATWTEVKQMTGCAGGDRVDEIVFDTLVDAQRIKIECINRNLTYGYSIYEIEAYGYYK